MIRGDLWRAEQLAHEVQRRDPMYPRINELIHGIERAISLAPLATRQPFEPEMMLIAAGEFLMGSDPAKDEHAHDEEQPQHRLHLPDYYIGKTQVTNAQYLAFTLATGYETPRYGRWRAGRPPEGRQSHPVAFVSWYDAMQYCQWLAEATGKPYGLPSEPEWEKAASWDAESARKCIYPWGDQWDETRCNTAEGGIHDTTPVDAYPQGASPYGLLDMAGNVGELTRSLWGRKSTEPEYRYPYSAADGRESLEAGPPTYRVVRGGSFNRYRQDVRGAYRFSSSPGDRYRSRGFRVVLSPIC
jgi:formylglycine-generating enzyme required for sulfatase activity